MPSVASFAEAGGLSMPKTVLLDHRAARSPATIGADASCPPTRLGPERGRRRGRARRRLDVRRRCPCRQGGTAVVGQRAGSHPRPGDRRDRPARRGERRGPWLASSPARWAKPYAEALGEVQEIIDTCDFFLGEGRRLYGETVPSEMHDKALVHLPYAGRRDGGHHCRQLPGRRALVVPRPGPAVRQHRRLEAGRVLGCGRHRPLRAVRCRAACRKAPSTSCSPTAPPPSRASKRAWRRGSSTRSGFTGSSVGRFTHRRADGPLRPVSLPRARRQEPDGHHGRRQPRAGRRGCAVLGLRDGRAALHVARHRHRARVAARRVRRAARRPPRDGRRSAIRTRPCSTGRCSTNASPIASPSTSAS